MVIELRGVEFVNKGAELMLHAIMQKVKENIPKADFTMELTTHTPAEKLKEFSIFQKKRNAKAQFIPRFIRKRLRWKLDKEIQVVLDASGFAFGDQWGSTYANKRIGSKISTWQKDGKKVILLPQAFGPFTNKELKVVMEKIIKHADLIFSREKQSYQYLKGVSQKNNIFLAPDFTNLLKGKIPVNFSTTDKQVAIIPNYKMIEKKVDGEQSYISFLLAAITKIRILNLKPYFLIHEGKRDLEISKKVNSLLQTPLEVVADADPLMIKGIISTAYFIVSSRFHGIVSALSQGVPCISTSWSHKYEMLHQEYNYEEGILKDINDLQELEVKISYLSAPDTNKIITNKISLNISKQKERSEEMWKTVFKVINVE